MNSRPAMKPKDDALEFYQLGLREQSAGRLDAAISLFDTALRIRPDFPEALCSGAYILQSQGRVDGAISFYKRALELKPDYFDAWFNLGCLLFDQGRLAEAIIFFGQACSLRPRDAGAQSNYGAALYRAGQLEEAVKALKRALKSDRRLIEAELNLGSALRRLGREPEALEAFQRALKLRPDCAEAHCGIGIIARTTGAFDEAMGHYNRALALDPNLEEALSSRGCLQLSMGDFAAGWEGYEHRWIDGHRPVAKSEARFDPADPATIAGRSVLVVNDHGLGDTMQFFRYVVMLAKGGAKVTFAGPAKMRRLLASCGADIAFRDEKDLSGSFDVAIAISSLPRAFSTRLETIPAAVPYLFAEQERSEFWRPQIAGTGLKVGLCWRGSQDIRVDPRRSFAPSAMLPLAGLEDVQFFALHMDVKEGELPEKLAERIQVFGDGFDTGPDAFVDTAAVMAGLDLIVTCDTSVAHLAGALGVPVWVTLRKVAEWRWLTDRDTSPWYPTMRLLRCEKEGDWQSLFQTIAGDIAALRQGVKEAQ
jgi:tetratricopeptide (TPR) repeat protein